MGNNEKTYLEYNLVKNIQKILKTKIRKKRMIFSIVLSNILVGVDLLIIYYFTSFFQAISIPKIPYLKEIIEIIGIY